MVKPKAGMRPIALLLSVIVFCVGTFIQEGHKPLPGAAFETKFAEITNSFPTYRNIHFDAFDNHHVILLGAFLDSEHAKVLDNTRKFAIMGQLLSIGRYEYYLSFGFSGIIMLGVKRISVLALSLGGNSPPVYKM